MKKNHTSSPRDKLEQQSALTGVTVVAQQGFMKQYFFLISPQTALSKSQYTDQSLVMAGPGEKQLHALKINTKSIIYLFQWCIKLLHFGLKQKLYQCTFIF